MARKKRITKNSQPPNSPAPAVFNQAFDLLSDLKKDLIRQEARQKKVAPITPPPPPPPQEPADEDLFRAEMADVMPLNGHNKHHQKKMPDATAWKIPELPDEDIEVLRNLSDLISGKAEFDLTYTDEYVEGLTRGLPPALMDQLRAGHIPIQDHLDLHGYTLTQAEAAVTRFILDSVALGRSCILLIHGRGLGSQDGVPVLKRYLETFLLRGTPRKYILAFTTARPIDGGLGASYILLRR